MKKKRTFCSKPAKNNLKLLLFLFRLLSYLLLLVLLMAMISPFVNPAITAVPSVIGIFFPFILMIALAFLVAGLWIDKSWLRVLLISVLLSIFFVRAFIN